MVRSILSALEKEGARLCAVNLVDSHYANDPGKVLFLSQQRSGLFFEIYFHYLSVCKMQCFLYDARTCVHYRGSTKFNNNSTVLHVFHHCREVCLGRHADPEQHADDGDANCQHIIKGKCCALYHIPSRS